MKWKIWMVRHPILKASNLIKVNIHIKHIFALLFDLILKSLIFIEYDWFLWLLWCVIWSIFEIAFDLKVFIHAFIQK